MDRAAELAGLPRRPCRDPRVADPRLPRRRGRASASWRSTAPTPRDPELMDDDARLAEPLHPALPYVGPRRWCGRCGRRWPGRSRTSCPTDAGMFLNAAAAVEMAPRVAELMAGSWGRTRRGRRSRCGRSGSWRRVCLVGWVERVLRAEPDQELTTASNAAPWRLDRRGLDPTANHVGSITAFASSAAIAAPTNGPTTGIHAYPQSDAALAGDRQQRVGESAAPGRGPG